MLKSTWFLMAEMNAFLQRWRISETGVQTESRNILLKCCTDTENTMFAIDYKRIARKYILKKDRINVK